MVLRSISLHRKILPGGMTFDAKASLLISERSFLFMHVRFPWSSWIACRSSVFLSAVMEACIVVVSRSIPRKVRVVEGPSCLLGFVGALIVLQSWFR